eukprot:scaffold12524_cov103-Isochrysis_galbana.AAC.5
MTDGWNTLDKFSAPSSTWPARARLHRRFPPVVSQRQPRSSVEPGAHKPQGTEVFIDEYNLAWHCVLNAVDLSEGTNKYYRMQLLRTGSSYCIYKAWGRVGGGAGGKSTGSGGRGRAGKLNSDLVHEHGTDLEGAKQEFRTKFKELARTDFEWTEPPCQVRGDGAGPKGLCVRERTSGRDCGGEFHLLRTGAGVALRGSPQPQTWMLPPVAPRRAAAQPAGARVKGAPAAIPANHALARPHPSSQAPGGYAVALLPGQMSDAATGAASAPSAGGHSLAGSKLPEPVAKFISIIGDKKMMADTLEERACRRPRACRLALLALGFGTVWPPPPTPPSNLPTPSPRPPPVPLTQTSPTPLPSAPLPPFQMHFDLDKMPLGSISEVQIKHGYEALTKLADALQSPAADEAEQRHRLLTLTTHFYTIIPHNLASRTPSGDVAMRGAARTGLPADALGAESSVAGAARCGRGRAARTSGASHSTVRRLWRIVQPPPPLYSNDVLPPTRLLRPLNLPGCHPTAPTQPHPTLAHLPPLSSPPAHPRLSARPLLPRAGATCDQLSPSHPRQAGHGGSAPTSVGVAEALTEVGPGSRLSPDRRHVRQPRGRAGAGREGGGRDGEPPDPQCETCPPALTAVLAHPAVSGQDLRRKHTRSHALSQGAGPSPAHPRPIGVGVLSQAPRSLRRRASTT